MDKSGISHIVRALRTACAVGIAGVLADGCTSYGVYADDWAGKASVKSGECPDIDGEYSGIGETVDESDGKQLPGRPIELATTLSEGIDYSIPGAEFLLKVSLQVVGRTLRVTATLSDGSDMRFERPVLDCQDSMLVMDADWHESIEDEEGAAALGTTMGMVHIVERKSWKLARAEDGSLLMRKSEGGSLMLFWFPVLPGWETTWVRFPRYVPAPEAGRARLAPEFRPVMREETLPGDR
jgi:hypothetical protein